MTKKELESKTVLELRALAKKLNITLRAKRKADIIKELMTGGVVPPPKKGAKPPAQKEAKPSTKKGEVPPAKKEAKPSTKKGTASPAKKGAKPPKEEAKAPKKRAKAKAETPTKERAKPKTKKKAPAIEATPVKKTTIGEKPSKHLPILPPEPETEYGEDMVTAISVEPTKIFVFWELKESTIRKIGGSPYLRIYDVTGIEDKSQSKSFFDIDCKNRIGSRYLEIQEDKEYIVEIGLSTKKKFIPIAQSQRTSAFRARPQAPKEPLVPEEYLDYLTISEEGSIPR